MLKNYFQDKLLDVDGSISPIVIPNPISEVGYTREKTNFKIFLEPMRNVSIIANPSMFPTIPSWSDKCLVTQESIVWPIIKTRRSKVVGTIEKNLLKINTQ